MNEFDKVYCVTCETIQLKHCAERVFKTGFYKTVIPLARCLDCAQIEAALASHAPFMQPQQNCADYASGGFHEMFLSMSR